MNAKLSERIAAPSERIAEFCRRWGIVELSLFGSVLGEAFSPDSDIDVLVSFSADAGWGLMDLVRMQDELKALFGREVDLVEKEALHNPFRRHHILTHREIIFAA